MSRILFSKRLQKMKFHSEGYNLLKILRTTIVDSLSKTIDMYGWCENNTKYPITFYSHYVRPYDRQHHESYGFEIFLDNFIDFYDNKDKTLFLLNFGEYITSYKIENFN